MKKIIACLFAFVIFTGCATTPLSPKPHQTKYAFQCLQLSIPDNAFLALSPSSREDSSARFLRETQIEAMLKHPDATIIEMPVVYADIGETVKYEQSVEVEVPYDTETVDESSAGNEIPRTAGKFIAVKMLAVEDNLVRYEIDLTNRELAAYEEVTTEDGRVVKCPFFRSFGIDTQMTQQPGSWSFPMWGMNHVGSGEPIHTMLLLRVIAPSTK